jgi:hypothetical protein
MLTLAKPVSSQLEFAKGLNYTLEKFNRVAWKGLSDQVMHF